MVTIIDHNGNVQCRLQKNGALNNSFVGCDWESRKWEMKWRTIIFWQNSICAFFANLPKCQFQGASQSNNNQRFFVFVFKRFIVPSSMHI